MLANDAETAFAAVMVRVHAPVPVHPPPDQPAKVSQVELGTAVSVTVAPLSIAAVHPPEEPLTHWIPGPLTVPCPSPVVVTVRV
jgi:hypothetical protein